MAWPLGIRLEGSRYFTAFTPASNDEENHPHEKKKAKINGKKKQQIKFHLSRERLFIFRCMSQPLPSEHSQNFSSVVLTTFLPDGAQYSLSWISAEKKWRPVTFSPLFSINLICVGSPPVVAFQEQSFFSQLIFLIPGKCW